MKKITMILLIPTIVFLTNVYSQIKLSPDNSIKQKNVACSSDYAIDFVKFDLREPMFSHEDKAGVWLRFTNKSNKTLTFQASIGSKTKNFVKNVGDELNIYYEVVEKENCSSENKGIEELPIGYRRVQTYFTINVEPKKSFVFSVAKQYFLPNRAIYITYECTKNCEKEENKLKKAYFFASELPKAVQDK